MCSILGSSDGLLAHCCPACLLVCCWKSPCPGIPKVVSLFVVYYALHEGCSCFGSSVAHYGSLVPMLLVVGCFAGSMYRGSIFSAWLVLGSMFHSTRLLCFTMDKGACSLGQCIFCFAGFQPVLQACLALFDLYTSNI